MAGFAVVSTISMAQRAPQWAEQYWQHLGVMDIFQRHFRCHDIVNGRVYCQMQLAPHSPFFGAVFPDLPLAFPKYLEAS